MEKSFLRQFGCPRASEFGWIGEVRYMSGQGVEAVADGSGDNGQGGYIGDSIRDDGHGGIVGVLVELRVVNVYRVRPLIFNQFV